MDNNSIKLPDEDLEHDGDEAWSPDNDLPKEEPTLGDIPQKK
jgi:hypothetical protein